jgi:hypothetical protein
MHTPETRSAIPSSDRSESPSGPPTSNGLPANPVKVDDSNVNAGYANFCRLSASPEELLMDFGLNPSPVANAAQTVRVKQRIVTGWYTAKRLVNALQLALQRHESAFGVLETDVRKRVKNE